jgi:hypothetical protein
LCPAGAQADHPGGGRSRLEDRRGREREPGRGPRILLRWGEVARARGQCRRSGRNQRAVVCYQFLQPAACRGDRGLLPTGREEPQHRGGQRLGARDRPAQRSQRLVLQGDPGPQGKGRKGQGREVESEVL